MELMEDKDRLTGLPVEYPGATEYPYISMLQLPGRLRRWRGIFALFLSAPVLAIPFVLWRASHAAAAALCERHAKPGYACRRIPLPPGVPPAAAAASRSPRFLRPD